MCDERDTIDIYVSMGERDPDEMSERGFTVVRGTLVSAGQV